MDDPQPLKSNQNQILNTNGLIETNFKTKNSETDIQTVLIVLTISKCYRLSWHFSLFKLI